jgi:hypothetical protein
MATRHPNPRLAKIHRNYTVEEIAKLFGAHRNTVRQWIRRGLPTIDSTRPTLILGSDLRAFLYRRRVQGKQPCRPGELYCVRCRSPKPPAERMVEYKPITDSLGNLIALCPDCLGVMNRRASIAKLDLLRPFMDITMPQAL